MQAQQYIESDIISLNRQPEHTDGFAADPVPIGTLGTEFREAMGGLASNDVDRAIGGIRSLIVQLDNRIAHARRNVQELESVRCRLIEGIRELAPPATLN